MNKIKLISLLAAAAVMTGSVAMAETYSAKGNGYHGEMTVDVALNPVQAAKYPFSRLTGPANVLVVPARHSASISVKLLQEVAGATVIGPILTGVPQAIQICSTNSTVNDILNMAAIAAGRLGQIK